MCKAELNPEDTLQEAGTHPEEEELNSAGTRPEEEEQEEELNSVGTRPEEELGDVDPENLLPPGEYVVPLCVCVSWGDFSFL